MDTDRTETNGIDTDPVASGIETDAVAKGHTKKGHMKRHGKALLATIGAATAVALAAGGVAAATSASSTHPATGTPPGSTAPGSTGAKHSQGVPPRLQRLLRRTVHAQFVLRTQNNGFETFDYDRGVLRSVTSSSIVIAPADAPNTVVSTTITSKTHFGGLPESKLQAGDHVALLYQGNDAVAVLARAPKPTTSPKG